MKTIATFTFKFKVIENSQTKKNCRVTIQLVEVKTSSYQIITNMYKGKDMINTERSSVSCYLQCKEIFFRYIERRNIDKLIMNNF